MLKSRSFHVFGLDNIHSTLENYKQKLALWVSKIFGNMLAYADVDSPR